MEESPESGDIHDEVGVAPWRSPGRKEGASGVSPDLWILFEERVPGTRSSRSWVRFPVRYRGYRPGMLLLVLLLAALVALGIVLAVTVVKWLFIVAVVAALAWLIVFFARRIA